MSFLTENNNIDLQLFEQALKADLLGIARDLIELHGVHEFAEGYIELSGVPFELEQVDSGNEGDGNYMYSVVEFKLNGKSYGFVRIGGTYSSWDSSEYDEDDLTVVELRQVVTSEYIAVDGSENSRYDRVLEKHEK